MYVNSTRVRKAGLGILKFNSRKTLCASRKFSSSRLCNLWGYGVTHMPQDSGALFSPPHHFQVLKNAISLTKIGLGVKMTGGLILGDFFLLTIQGWGGVSHNTKRLKCGIVGNKMHHSPF